MTFRPATLVDKWGVPFFQGEIDDGGGGGSLIVTDGGTTVNPVTEIDFAGAAVADGGNGIASVTVDAGIPQGGPLDQDLDAGGNSLTNVLQIVGTGDDFDTGGGQMKTSGGALDLGGARAKGLDDPTEATDGVPRDWANARVGGAVVADAGEGQIPVVSSGAVGFSDLTVGQSGAPPSGAPSAGQLPFAWDSTAVTGGFYFWNSAAWIKVANIL